MSSPLQPEPHSAAGPSWRGDRETVRRFLKDAVRPPRVAPGEHLRAELDDERMGTVGITAMLREVPGCDVLFVLVHGLGGGPDSTYILRSSRALLHHGFSTLAVALRGADRGGDDFYNVALAIDLDTILAHPRLAAYTRIHVIGYSMGGYVTLHHARAPRDPRVRASVALCTPMDLADAQVYIDAPRAFFYRRHVLGGLKEIYDAVARRGRPIPSPNREVQAVPTIREWDRLTIAPRYGYRSPEHYYEELSIRPHLAQLAVPALLVMATEDPVVPVHTALPHVPRGGPVELRLAERSGHLAFERHLDLGQPAKLGLEAQYAAWCLSR
ncbi:MAG: alpha/beta fold hydrolase [Planctomycetaceae bacterium]|nr:alpha/beta fold hydrolase [Planctomycetaceae bacterium]